MKRLLAGLVWFAFAGCAGAENAASDAEPNPQLEIYGYRIVETYPHDPSAFTQGLFIDDGALFETTGQYGQSRLFERNIETGAAERERALPLTVFGEGSTIVDDRIIVLTWRSGTGIVFDRETFEPVETFSYGGEGWGLAYDGARLIMSDGTSVLRFLDPETFEETGRLDVTLRGEPLENINELEWVNGEIFANVWHSNAVVRIDPESGSVTGVIDLRGLLSAEDTAGGADVLNGLAYDPDTERLFVTGKYWPKLFEIEVVERQP